MDARPKQAVHTPHRRVAEMHYRTFNVDFSGAKYERRRRQVLTTIKWYGTECRTRRYCASK